MAVYPVTGDQYRDVDRRMSEIKRQLNQKGGSSLDPERVLIALQSITEGDLPPLEFPPADSLRNILMPPTDKMVRVPWSGFELLDAELTSMRLSQLPLESRVVNRLSHVGLLTVGETMLLTADSIGDLNGIGPGGVKSIRQALASLELRLLEPTDFPPTDWVAHPIYLSHKGRVAKPLAKELPWETFEALGFGHLPSTVSRELSIAQVSDLIGYSETEVLAIYEKETSPRGQFRSSQEVATSLKRLKGHLALFDLHLREDS